MGSGHLGISRHRRAINLSVVGFLLLTVPDKLSFSTAAVIRRRLNKTYCMLSLFIVVEMVAMARVLTRYFGVRERRSARVAGLSDLRSARAQARRS